MYLSIVSIKSKVSAVRRRLGCAGWCLFLLLLANLNAQADTGEPSKNLITIAPYGWATNLSGSISLSGLQLPITLSTGTIASNLNSAGMGVLRWQRGDYFVLMEGIFMDYEDPSAAIAFNQRVESTLKFSDLGFGKQWQVKIGGRPLTLAPYVSLRYTEVKTRVEGNLVSLSSDDHWYDPTLGVVASMSLTENLGIISKVDIASAAWDANRSKSALAMLTYKVFKGLSVSGGYRWADAHYDSDGGLGFELKGEGVLLGVMYSFGF